MIRISATLRDIYVNSLYIAPNSSNNEKVSDKVYIAPNSSNNEKVSDKVYRKNQSRYFMFNNSFHKIMSFMR